jgi:serine/threonine-protein kinase HipA
MTVSGLTLLNLDELAGRYATYPELLDILRTHSTEPDQVGPDLFRRVAVNIAVGNTDDHARNHAAFWDGTHLRLTPAYDIDPCRTPGWDANQAMAYGRRGERVSSLRDLLATAAVYGLTTPGARTIIDTVVGSVRDQWSESLDAAHLSDQQGQQLLGSRILHPAVLDGL